MEKEVRDIRQMIDTFYKELSRAANIPKTSRFNSTWQKYTSQLFKFAYKASRSQILDMDGLFSGQRPETINWSYGNSFLYATTVVTTLGYGNLLPATMFGRIFFIFYATFGIPFLLVTIADIGKFNALMLSHAYRKCVIPFSSWKRKLRGIFRKRQLAKRRGQTHDSSTNPGEMPDSDTDSSSDYVSLRIPMFIVLFIGAVYVVLGAAIFCTWSAKGTTCSSWPSAIFYAFLVSSKITAIGLDGDDGTRATLSTPNVVIFVIYAIIGLSCATMLIDLAGTAYIRKIHRIYGNLRYFSSWIGKVFIAKNTKTTQKFSEEIVHLPEAVHSESHGLKPISASILPENSRILTSRETDI
ncbi:ion channel domain-containing protein [Ditylenchus destructor]|nr:ion channel domain-containing protein [Ditylenchus destructor]